MNDAITVMVPPAWDDARILDAKGNAVPFVVPVAPEQGLGPAEVVSGRDAVQQWLTRVEQVPVNARVARLQLYLAALSDMIQAVRSAQAARLKAGLALVLLEETRAHEWIVDPAGQPLCRNAETLVQAILVRLGAGTSAPRISSLRTGARIWRALFRAELPLPATLSRLEPLAAFPVPTAVAIYQRVATGPVAPKWDELEAARRRLRGDLEVDAGTSPKPRGPEPTWEDDWKAARAIVQQVRQAEARLGETAAAETVAEVLRQLVEGIQEWVGGGGERAPRVAKAAPTRGACTAGSWRLTVESKTVVLRRGDGAAVPAEDPVAAFAVAEGCTPAGDGSWRGSETRYFSLRRLLQFLFPEPHN